MSDGCRSRILNAVRVFARRRQLVKRGKCPVNFFVSGHNGTAHSDPVCFQGADRGDVLLLSAPLDPFLPSALVLGLIVTSEARDQAQALQMTFLIGIPMCFRLRLPVWPTLPPCRSRAVSCWAEQPPD